MPLLARHMATIQRCPRLLLFRSAVRRVKRTSLDSKERMCRFGTFGSSWFRSLMLVGLTGDGNWSWWCLFFLRLVKGDCCISANMAGKVDTRCVFDDKTSDASRIMPGLLVPGVLIGGCGKYILSRAFLASSRWTRLCCFSFMSISKSAPATTDRDIDETVCLLKPTARTYTRHVRISVTDISYIGF
jgi:hypothetical protein